MSSSGSRSGAPRPKLSIVLAYYDNPKMLEYQFEFIRALPAQLLRQLEVVVIDDASPLYPAVSVAERFSDLPLLVFRIAENKPWNQDAARNIGAYECSSESMLLTDVDHVASVATLKLLISHGTPKRIYSLGRTAHFTGREIHSHVNSYFLSKEDFWAVGGYDEDFWGTYGTDVFFRNRLNVLGGVSDLPGTNLGLVTQGSILDAKTHSLSRVTPLRRRLRSWAMQALKRIGLMKRLRVLSNPYEKVFPH